jgi:hypothetical protein
MSKAFRFIFFVLITFALSAKAFIPLEEMNHAADKFQLSLNEALELELEESKADIERFHLPLLLLDFDWMVFADLSLQMPSLNFTTVSMSGPAVRVHEKQFLLFQVLRI